MVLFKRIERSRILPSPDLHGDQFGEGGVLVVGIVTGATVRNLIVEKIRELLYKDPTQSARICEGILKSDSLVLTSIEIPLENAIKIYSLRASLNKERGGPILGFEELIPSLEREKTDKVGIHSVERGEQWLFAFTTPEMDRLLGVLCSSQKSPTKVTGSIN